MSGPLGDLPYRWLVTAALRAALYDLEHGMHANIVVKELRTALDALEGTGAQR